MILAVFIAVCACYALAYATYARFLERRMDLDGDHPTPATSRPDGVDYVATPSPVLFGHHFSSIAGAGPIVGPIIAGLAFGWAPAALWILLGAIFVGGVHDFTAMAVSLRHDGRSIADICRATFNPMTYRLLLLFILFTLTYVIIVFLDLTATGFAPLAVATDAAGRAQQIEGGVVATASLLYIGLALLFGILVYRGKLSLRAGTLVFVPLVFGGLWFGQRWPLTADLMPGAWGAPKDIWTVVLLVYCFAASVLPVWLLLQPRDYLSSFLLYGCIGGGALGLVIAGVTGTIPTAQPAFRAWRDAQLGWIFPALFVTVACGAVSGFHAIVASGTTAKQLARERDARPVAYGGMLVEGVLAMLAIATVMLLPAGAHGAPTQIFAAGLGRFLTAIGIPAHWGTTFGLLAVSTFLLTTLDTCTRLARFIAQELVGAGNGRTARMLATAAVLLVPALVVFREIPGPGGTPMPAWKAIWPAFGATNQLMAALALLVVTAWLRRRDRPIWYVVLPTAFMCVTTLTALGQLIWLNLRHGGSAFIGWLSLALAALALLVLGNALWLMGRRPASAAP